jgi:hypothetical protein
MPNSTLAVVAVVLSVTWSRANPALLSDVEAVVHVGLDHRGDCGGELVFGRGGS